MTVQVSGGIDQREYVADLMVRAALADAGIPDPQPTEIRDFRGEAARTRNRRFLEWAGVSFRGMTEDALAGRALEEGLRSGATTTTLPGFTSNVFSRAMNWAFLNTPTLFRKLCRFVRLPDYKRANLVAVDGLASLSLVPETGGFPSQPITDRTEFLQLRAYGANVLVTRATALASDLGSIIAKGAAAGKAAAATIDDLIVDTLLLNSATGPVLNADGVALFDAAHNNLQTSGGAPSVATLNDARATMRLQKDANDQRVQGIAPKYLIAPAALESTSRILAASENIPGADDTLEVLCAPRLDATSSAAWYLAADPRLYDGFVCGYLNEGDEPAPVTFEQDGMGWLSDAVVYKVRLDVAVAIADYRAWFRNDGA